MPEVSHALKIEHADGGVRLQLSGRLDADAVAEIWDEALGAAKGKVTVDASAVEYCDGAGSALLCELRRRGGGEITGLRPEIARVFELFEGDEESDHKPEKPVDSPLESLG